MAIGGYAGRYYQSANGIAIGENTAESSQGLCAIAIGTNAGRTSQASGSIAIGFYAGVGSQGIIAVAFGLIAGRTSQASGAVAIGESAGENTQGQACVAIGRSAGQFNQKNLATAVGFRAGETNQGTGAVAIGYVASRTNQGQYSVALGYGANSTFANSIAIMAQGNTANLFSDKANACFIRPVANRASYTRFLGYDTTTYEVFETASSAKYKDNIKNAERDYDDVLKLVPREYRFKSTDEIVIGYIAEEVYDINPEFATTGMDKNGEPDNIYWFNLAIYQNEVIKRHDKEIKDLQTEINALKNPIV